MGMAVGPGAWVALRYKLFDGRGNLLETTDEPVELIAERAGFGTAATLRLHFQRAVAVPPQTYRHVFRTSRQRAH